jgi:hypothetical protein
LSCTNNQQAVEKAAVAAAISATASKNGYIAGVTPAAGVPLSPAPAVRPKGKRKQPNSSPRKRRRVKKAKRAGKTMTRKESPAGDKSKKKDEPAPKKTKQRPFFATVDKVKSGPRRIAMKDKFTPDELQALSVQLSYGGAAVSRALKETQNGVDLGVGHSDPRPMDWARQDQKHFQFILGQLARVRYRGQKHIDLSALNDDELVDLYEFSQFEAERHHRNIDHLTAGLSHLKGATAEYMVSRHTLQVRFHSFMADQIEPFITLDMLDDTKAISVD